MPRLSDEYAKSISTLPSSEQTGPTVELGAMYAFQIDMNPLANLNSMGPKLLAVLDALNLTPKSRIKLGREVDDASSELFVLDELRARRLGQDRSADSNTATS